MRSGCGAPVIADRTSPSLKTLQEHTIMSELLPDQPDEDRREQEAARGAAPGGREPDETST